MDSFNIFSQSELDALPIISVIDACEVVYGGLILDEIGDVIGKIPGFIDKGITYFRSYPHAVAKDDEPDKLTLIPWSTLRDQVFPHSEWYIQGLVPKYGITMLAAVSGEKKSWLALYMAYCITTGTHLFGDDRFPAVQGRVLYIDAEMGPRELQRRGKLLGFDNIIDGQLLLMSGNSLDLRPEEEFECLVDSINEHDINVVVVDTLRAVAGGLNEDKAEEVRGFLQRFNQLKNQGVAVIILDHCRKPIRNEGYSPKKEQLFGSQDKVASAESVIMIKSELQSEAFAVYQVKSRTGGEIKPFMVLMKDVAGEDRIEFCYNGEYDERVSKMDTAKLVIPQTIDMGIMTTKELIECMQRDHKVGERYVREALRELVSTDRLVIEKLGRENAYRNTEVGLLVNRVGDVLGVAEVIDQ